MPRSFRPTQPPPNVLFLFSDDQRHDTIGALGNSHIKTPHLDRLARRSFTFSRAYNFDGNTGAVCIPARNMVMTGKTWIHFDAGSRDHYDPATLPVPPNFKPLHPYDMGMMTGRDERWKLIRLPQINKSMLFDLANDPHETTDLASDPEKNKIMERMTAMLRQEQRRLGDTLPLTTARPKPASFTPKKSRIKTPFPAGGLAPGK